MNTYSYLTLDPGENKNNTFVMDYQDSEIKDYEMGGTCSTYLKDEQCIQNFSRQP
jgi:hypothetical protein